MPWFDSLPISTYTLSLELCERCGWWDPAVIPEDWHAYLNCLFETGDEIARTPDLPADASATPPTARAWRDAMKNRFEQLKRHSWGAEDVGYIWGQLTERKQHVALLDACSGSRRCSTTTACASSTGSCSPASTC